MYPPALAVARRRARHRTGLGSPAAIERGAAGHLPGPLPGPLVLADDERLNVRRGVLIVPARRTVARRGARHRSERGVPALVEPGGTGHLRGGTPPAADLADHERLPAARSCHVETPGGAVTRNSARHRGNPASLPLAERRDPGNLPGLLPGAADLADDKRLLMPGAVGVEPARRAVARRATRQPQELALALVQRRSTRHRPCPAPTAAQAGRTGATSHPHCGARASTRQQRRAHTSHDRTSHHREGQSPRPHPLTLSRH